MDYNSLIENELKEKTIAFENELNEKTIKFENELKEKTKKFENDRKMLIEAGKSTRMALQSNKYKVLDLEKKLIDSQIELTKVKAENQPVLLKRK